MAAGDDREPRAFRFGRRFRMRGDEAFSRAFEGRVRTRVGPLLVYGRPNSDLSASGDTRLGLSVSRRCGNSVARHRLKRLIREAFRTIRQELPAGYDLLVVAHPHVLIAVDDYRRLLRRAAEELDRRWRRERPNDSTEPPPRTAEPREPREGDALPPRGS
jgi:ribonuclease P protein component